MSYPPQPNGPWHGAQGGAAPVWTVVRHPVTVAGATMPGEMLYVGRGLVAAGGGAPEPALIDPWMAVDWRAPDWQGRMMGYWPSYTAISPQSRAAYLHWLIGGRCHPATPIGYVFLFFYGLERRVLLELPHMPGAQGTELPAIAAEVDRLLGIYGGNTSFAGHAGRFRELLDVLAPSSAEPWDAGPPEPDREHAPLRLRLGLGRFAATGTPVPAEWARAWVMSRPDFYPRTPVTRCGREFTALFDARYRARCHRGLVLGRDAPDVTVRYRPASAGFPEPAVLRLHGRPEVFDQAAPLRVLTTLADECMDALDAYSRLIGRDPAGRGGIAAAALLPAEVVDLNEGRAGALVGWARARLGEDEDVAEADAGELAAIVEVTERPAKKDIVAAAQVLEKAGIGIEPDPRLGGPVRAAGPVVLFRAGARAVTAPSPAYASAALLLHFGVAVSAADGRVAEQEVNLLTRQVEQAPDLTHAERTRLRAHLRWLLATEVKLTGLTRRVSDLPEERRERVADLLAGIAAADGVIEAGEIRTLERIRALLGLDPAGVHGSLHSAAAGSAPATGPVTVRPGMAGAGHRIPPGPAPEQNVGQVRLDESLLAARLAEADEVARLLGSVFEEEEEETEVVATAPATQPAVEPVAGLDDAHSALVRSLADRETISREEWERLAAEVRVLPDGALDRLNEAAYEVTGEPLAEGDDPIEINRYAMGELL